MTGIGVPIGSRQPRARTAGGRWWSGQCGVRPVSVFDTEGFRSRVAAEVDLTALDGSMTPLERRRNSRGDRIALHAAAEAIDDAGFMDSVYDASRVGIFLGAGTGDLLRNEDYYRTWITRGLDRARPSDAWNHFLSTPVDAIAARFGFEGPRGCIVAACSSSTIAIGRAVEAIRAGRADLALAGGADALARLTFSGFNQLRLMDPQPCRPFDRGRAGMNIGEGAGVLVLENLVTRTTPRRSRVRRAGRPWRRLRSLPSNGARAERHSGRGGRRAGALGRPSSAPTPWTTSTRTAPPRRRTTPPRRVDSRACSALASGKCR